MARFEVKKLFRRTEKIDSEIEYLGGINSDGTNWKINVESAILGLESKKWNFFIIKDGIEIDLISVKINGKKNLACNISNLDFLNINAFNL